MVYFVTPSIDELMRQEERDCMAEAEAETEEAIADALAVHPGATRVGNMVLGSDFRVLYCGTCYNEGCPACYRICNACGKRNPDALVRCEVCGGTGGARLFKAPVQPQDAHMSDDVPF